ncbi:MAG: helix-turn-helix domain-containing protein [Pseudonocardia sp.]
MQTTRGSAYRLDVWRDLIREHFVALDIDADRDVPFAGHVATTAVGPLRVASVDSRDQRCVRTPGLARRADDVYLQVGLVARGAALLSQDGREAAMGVGDFAIYETDRPFTWELRGDWRLLVFTWPRSVVGVAPGESRRLTARRLSGADGLGGIVGRMLGELVADPPELSGTGAERLAREVAELVATVAGEHADPAGPAPDNLLRRIDGYIADRLGDPDLCPESIARAHFVSTRQLHRLFARRGVTVSRYVRGLRLERSRGDLAAGHDVTVGEVARRWGFGDAASFSRAYRRRFGVPPSHAARGS